MPNGIFDSNDAATPAVKATGTNGADGVDATSDTGNGVSGLQQSLQGNSGNAGVFGSSLAFNSNGVIGEANNGPDAFGVWGRSITSDPTVTTGFGVFAESTNGTGVSGTSTDGTGVVAQSTNLLGLHAVGGGATFTPPTAPAAIFAEGGPNTGISAFNNSTNPAASTIEGNNFGVGPAITGNSTNGTGVVAQSTNGIGLHAVGGRTSPTSNPAASLAAILAEGGDFIGIQAAGAGGITPTQPSIPPVVGAVVAYGSPGIFVQNNTPSGRGFAMHVVGGGTSPSNTPRLGQPALFVESGIVGSISTDGIVSQAPSSGILGICTSSSGSGVFGFSNDGTGVLGESQNGNAGVFRGFVTITRDLTVDGSIIKRGGGFLIDHPKDPAHKSLFHSFVESPDMKNIYDGVVVLDAQGETEVTLPSWFDALNTDFRYQLTCLGGYAPVYIAEEISANHFKIAGGKPHMKVSWQVTGIRQDAWARANRLPTEQDKPAQEHGYYRHPELYGESEQKSIARVRYPEPEIPVLPKQ